ncbi:MAG TPA: hypothetical protein VFX20_19955 [Steroidobacteraceae bacterium]|nr:hypothetical protein [Steroidobacteraceae bacterium]
MARLTWDDEQAVRLQQRREAWEREQAKEAAQEQARIDREAAKTAEAERVAAEAARFEKETTALARRVIETAERLGEISAMYLESAKRLGRVRGAKPGDVLHQPKLLENLRLVVTHKLGEQLALIPAAAPREWKKYRSQGLNRGLSLAGHAKPVLERLQ